MKEESLQAYLAREVGDATLEDLIDRIASACWKISNLVRGAALSGNLGTTAEVNPQGEAQKPLDLLADTVFSQSCRDSSALAALISEEIETVTWLREGTAGRYVVSYDPLDGSSNLDVDLSVGSVFAISRIAPAGVGTALVPGRDLVCSGYALYGPSTIFVLTFGNRVDGFSLSNDGDSFVLSHPNMSIPVETQEFAINVSRLRFWDETVRTYIADCIEGAEGVRGKPFNMRWTASMVADVHRILVRGGIFLYPKDSENAAEGGKLRLLYEANPMAMIVEAAGGLATDGQRPLLDIVPQSPHQRTAVVLGSRSEVERLAKAYAS